MLGKPLQVLQAKVAEPLEVLTAEHATLLLPVLFLVELGGGVLLIELGGACLSVWQVEKIHHHCINQLVLPRPDVVLGRGVDELIDGELLLRIHPKDVSVFALQLELLVHRVYVLEVGLLLGLIR